MSDSLVKFLFYISFVRSKSATVGFEVSVGLRPCQNVGPMRRSYGQGTVKGADTNAGGRS